MRKVTCLKRSCAKLLTKAKPFSHGILTITRAQTFTKFFHRIKSQIFNTIGLAIQHKQLGILEHILEKFPWVLYYQRTFRKSLHSCSNVTSLSIIANKAGLNYLVCFLLNLFDLANTLFAERLGIIWKLFENWRRSCYSLFDKQSVGRPVSLDRTYTRRSFSHWTVESRP